MKMLVLKKQYEPRFDELNEMLCGLKDFLDAEADFNDKKWYGNFNALLDFQDPDGSFKLFGTFDIPTDARVDFCYIPTYISAAVLMKAYMTDPESFTLKETSALSKGLEMSCARNLRGHGYEGLKGQIEALNIFMKAGLKEFLDLHPDICPEFSDMIEKIISKFKDMESDGDFLGPWGESYEDEIKSVNEYFCQRKVFVYGTLMSGEANHHYLENGTFLGNAVIEGYDMYNVGAYPAIVPGDNIIVGELYQVPIGDMASVDMLEGEGSLYLKKCETLRDGEGKTTFAFVYVYLGDCSGLKRISAWNRQYVWYVSYGSNMLEKRFLCYIKGGSFDESRYRQTCSDTTPPLAVRTVEIPYDMYFANRSGSWQGGGVSFLDTSKKGKALGVAYLITEEQFEHVAAEENGGRPPKDGCEWYENIIELEPMGGFEVRTITNRNLRDYNEPSHAYWQTLRHGIRQHWPDMSAEEIRNYLMRCIR